MSVERVRRHREKMRKAGLRPLQIWVPNTKQENFAAECERQSMKLQIDPQEKEILEWIDAVADTKGWK